jgi:hypothetical protein
MLHRFKIKGLKAKQSLHRPKKKGFKAPRIRFIAAKRRGFK